jgi:hypothetical protein
LNIDDTSISHEHIGSYQLPKVLNIRISKTIFKLPNLRFIRSRLEKYENKEIITIFVLFANPLPMRALGPVLYIDNSKITESATLSPTEIKFFVFDDTLKTDEIIRIGWSDEFPENCIDTGFKYKLA